LPGVTTFDKHREDYEAWFAANPQAYEAELRAVRALLPEAGNGLEIGVGSGRFAAPLGIRYGVEPSRAMREKARERGIKVIKGVAEALPFGEQEFDFALMVTTICFLDDMDLAFGEVLRVLKPDGCFIIGFVDRESPLGKFYQARKAKSTFYKEATFFSVDELIIHLKEAGFRRFTFRQTLFRPLQEISASEPVKEGHGEGSFVAIKATP